MVRRPNAASDPFRITANRHTATHPIEHPDTIHLDGVYLHTANDQYKLKMKTSIKPSIFLYLCNAITNTITH